MKTKAVKFIVFSENKMAGGEADKDVHISLEDQQKINKFARQNQRMEELKDDLKVCKCNIFLNFYRRRSTYFYLFMYCLQSKTRQFG